MKTHRLDSDSEDNVKLSINRYLLDEFGLNIGIHKVTKKENRYIVQLAYSKVFNIFDEPNKKVYIRAITFDNIYTFEHTSSERIRIKRKILNENIKSEFLNLRNSITLSVLENKDIIKQLLHLSGVAYLFQKFHYLLVQLVDKDKIEIDSVISKEEKYMKYIDFLISIGYIERNRDGEFLATNEVHSILEEKRRDKNIRPEKLLGETVDDILCDIVKNHLDYLVNILQFKIKRFINIMSCFYFLRDSLALSELHEISLDKLYQVYVRLIEKVPKSRIYKSLRQLQYVGIVSLSEDKEKQLVISHFT